MKETSLFQIIHKAEIVNNSNIVHFTKRFPHKIGVTPILVLLELYRDGAQKQTVLAEKMGITPGAMTNIANKLVKLGYAQRLYNEDDRRHVLMEILPAGEIVLKDARIYGSEVQREIFEVLTEEELGQYLAIVEKLLQAAVARNEAAKKE